MQSGKRTRHTQLLLVVIALSLMTLRHVNGAGLEDQQKALNMISDFADRICSRIPLEGETGELSGQAKADLSSVLRQLVGLDVTIKGNVESRHYQGILQHELATVIAESNNCRRAVSSELISKVFEPSSQPPEPPPQGPSRRKSPNHPPPTPTGLEMVKCKIKIGYDEVTFDTGGISALTREGPGIDTLSSQGKMWGYMSKQKGDSCPGFITSRSRGYGDEVLKFCISAEGVVSSKGKVVGNCEACNFAQENCHALQIPLP